MKDFLLNNDLDLQTANGDFVTGESSEQHQQLLLACNKGDFKENPTVCVGAAGYLKSNEPNELLAEIKKEFENDGMQVRKVAFTTDGNLNIDASY